MFINNYHTLHESFQASASTLYSLNRSKYHFSLPDKSDENSRNLQLGIQWFDELPNLSNSYRGGALVRRITISIFGMTESLLLSW